LHRVYNRIDSNRKSVPRKWITVECINYYVKAIYCTICIAFSISNSPSNFCNGCTNFKNIYAAIEFHEISKGYSSAVEANFSVSNENSIEFVVSRDIMNHRKSK